MRISTYLEIAVIFAALFCGILLIFACEDEEDIEDADDCPSSCFGSCMDLCDTYSPYGDNCIRGEEKDCVEENRSAGEACDSCPLECVTKYAKGCEEGYEVDMEKVNDICDRLYTECEEGPDGCSWGDCSADSNSECRTCCVNYPDYLSSHGETNYEIQKLYECEAACLSEESCGQFSACLDDCDLN
jgi:hypothetical protein